MRKARLMYVAMAILVMASVSRAALITNVIRANGAWADRDRPPIHTFTGDTTPLPGMDDGLGDGNGAFSDRPHVWANTPTELIGAEYVRTFNSDKTDSDVTLTVTLGNGILYLILDNRMGYADWAIPFYVADREFMNPILTAAGMDWVTAMGFTDTGLNIAIDEEYDGSINNWSSIFAKQVSAGTYTLFHQSDHLNSGNRNMYGIAAIPEPMTLALLALGGLIASRKGR